MGNHSRKIAEAIRAAHAPECPHGSYQPYGCSPSGVVMPDRITTDEHTMIGDLFSGICICEGCHIDRSSAKAARRILAAAGKEFWQMTQREFMHPKFDVRALDRIKNGKEGETVGTLGDYLRGEKIRALYAPVLDIPIMILNGPIENGKRLKMPEGIAFKGALGSFRGKMTIFLPSGTINGLVTSLMEEGAHAMRESKGRESPKTSMDNFDWDAYEALPHEQSAAAMSEHARSLKEKNHRDFVEEALAAGEAVPPEVLADYPDLAPDAVAHTAAAGLAALGETIPYDGELWHGTSLGGAASIARGGFLAQPHAEMSAETVSLSRNPIAAEIFAGHQEGVVFEFDIRLNRLFVVPEFVYDAMLCYRGSGACDEDAIRRMAENADTLKQIGALPAEWEGDEPPDWSEWRGSDMNEYDWLEKLLPGYDGVVVPGFHSTQPNAEAEIAVFDSVARRLVDSVVMMSVAGRIYSTEGGEGESIEDGWNALGAIDPGEHELELDAAIHKAAMAVRTAETPEPAEKPLVLYHGTAGTGIDRLEAGPGKYQRVAGIYLSKSRAEAEKYTKIDGVKHPENVLTVHAYLRNPATRDVLDELGNRLDGDQMQAELIHLGYDGVIDELMDEVVVFDPGQLSIVSVPQEVTANTATGGWSDHWDQSDLWDAVVYATEIYGDEWGWKLDPESVGRQMDEVLPVGFREMDPRDYTDISALGPLGDHGWMKDEPSDDWPDLLEYEYDRPFGHIVEAWLARRLSPAVFFEGVGEGDGRARALFLYALGMPLRAAIFRYEGRNAACAVALRRAARRIASIGTIVAYHATRAGSAIMQEGFKKSTEVSGGGLGGSSYQGSVSFTTDWEVAKGIYDAFVLMHSLVNADDPMKAISRHFKSLEPGVQGGLLKLLEGSFGSEVLMTMQGWRFKYDRNAMTEGELQERGFRPRDDATFEKDGKTLYYGWYEPMEEREKEKIVYYYVNAYGYSESSKYNPMFMGGDSKHFKGIPKSDIGIVTVELNIDPSRKMKNHGESGEGYAILPVESEYRVTDMSMIGRILDYDSDPGDEPKVQALEKSYHADDETEKWVNRLLMVFQRNRRAMDGSGISVRQMMSNFRSADDMHTVRSLAGSALKAIGMDRMDLSLKNLMKLKGLSEPSEIAGKAMDAMPPEVFQRVERSDDFVQVSEWWADRDEESYLRWVDRMYGMGINESSAEFEIDEWIRSRYHAKRFQEELASLSRFADGLNEGNLDNFAEVSKVLYEVVETNPYLLRASAAPTVGQIATEARRQLVGDYDLGDDPPKAMCMEFAEYLTERLREAGYDAKFVRGTFHLDYPDPSAYEDWDPDDFEDAEEMEEAKQNALHYWAEVDGKTVVDITADQFADETDEEFEPVTVGSYAELGRYTPQDRR